MNSIYELPVDSILTVIVTSSVDDRSLHKSSFSSNRQIMLYINYIEE